MGLKTPEEFKESLRDGRVVYLDGEKVDDVTTRPRLKIAVETAAADYAMAEMPEFRDLAVVDDGTGEPYSRYFYWPRNGEDLLKQHELMLVASRLNYMTTPFAREMIDSFNGCAVTAYTMGNKDYIERIEAYLDYLKKNDLSLAGAITDVKGDRSLRPADPKQKHQDYYLRIIDRNKDGIVVRGAKAHITGAAYLNELIVMPCRRLTEADADYAVAFATPVNAKGIIQIAHPFDFQRSASDFPLDIPARGHTDSLIIFDDVFVPWERVFLCGEWQHAATAVYNFAYLHRHTASTYHIAWFELLVGLAATVAEYNGVAGAANIREQMTELIFYLNTVKSLARASCIDYVMHGGRAIPNPITANAAKYFYATYYHNCTKIIEDFCGGLIYTMPTYRDWQNSDTGGFIDRYLGGKADAEAEARLRILNTLKHYPCLGWEIDVLNLHGEGSLMAQRLTIYSEAKEDIALYSRVAKVLSGITRVSEKEYTKLVQDLAALGKGVQ